MGLQVFEDKERSFLLFSKTGLIFVKKKFSLLPE